jgi:hypothetical protein
VDALESFATVVAAEVQAKVRLPADLVCGFVKDRDAMEYLLSYVLYRNIGWEMGDEGQILFTEPLFMPKVMLRSVCSV